MHSLVSLSRVLLLFCAAMTVALQQAQARGSSGGTTTVSSPRKHKPTGMFNPVTPLTQAAFHTPTATSPASAAASVVQAPSAAYPQQLDNLYQPILERHNKYRSQHGAPPLAWDQPLADAAAAYISRCLWLHDADRGYAGENMYATSAADAADALIQAIDGWYLEATQYNHSDPGFSLATGHFTQVVWKDSTTLGCAANFCSNVSNMDWTFGITLVICRYSPPGNYWGEFETNVLPIGTVYQPPTNPNNPGGQNPSPSTSPNSSPSPSPAPSNVENGPNGTVNPGPSPSPDVSNPNVTLFDPWATLPGGFAFTSDDPCMMSASKMFKLCVAKTGIVTLSQVKPRAVLWKTNKTLSKKKHIPPAWLWLLEDGTLVVTDDGGSLIWSANKPRTASTAPKQPILVLADTGNMAIYANATFDARRLKVSVGNLIWQTNTTGMIG